MPITRLHMRTLILDDEEPIVHMLALMCEKQGHVVFPFCDSTDALIQLASTPIDLLITDMHMPGPDGVAVIKEARRLQPNLFTLIITGHVGKYPIEELLADGTADIMFKPFHMNELKARLALASRRRALAERMNAEKVALHAVSKEMILGLQEEIREKRRTLAPGVPEARG
jgi:DNA-binding response OmpR family regulator